MVEIALVRHGETDWNVQGKMQGHRNIPLNERGIRQADRLAARLAAGRWDGVFSSDLSRAAMTAGRVASRAGVPAVVLDARLRERHYGRLEGTTEEERVRLYGPNWRRLLHGAESDGELFARAESFLGELAGRKEGRFIVVTHGGWIRCVFRRLFPDFADIRPGNTSLSLLEHRGGIWRCLLAGDMSHLD
mgnify:CR=1 FL=1